MHYSGNIFRPPAEHDSILLQVTEGCSHNKCRFCGLYKDKKFKIKDIDLIKEDLVFASKYFKMKKRLFLCDGDALIIPQEKLLLILKEIQTALPWITRIGTYGNAKSIMKKSLDELKELKKNKLGIIYMGLESGDDEILASMNKGVDVNTQIEQGKKIKEAGMKVSITVLLGLGGKKHSQSHAVKTGEALSLIDPNYANALSLMMFPQMPLYQDVENDNFDLLDPYGILQELYTMIEHTNLSAGIFSANHASNYLPLQFRIPGGKEEALQILSEALKGGIKLKPEYLRMI
jgi:radical SAM superfamily enzyme YgiQ (UPF0313 family)